jgi:hypothetical protein
MQAAGFGLADGSMAPGGRPFEHVASTAVGTGGFPGAYDIKIDLGMIGPEWHVRIRTKDDTWPQ